MKRNAVKIAFAVAAIAAIAAAWLVFGGRRKLADVEIREYEGENLSSIYDFRENSIKGSQKVDEQAYRLKIGGLAENPQEYSYSEVIGDNSSHRKTIRLECVEGWSAKILWEGVLVRDLLAKAGPLPEATTVIFRAYDGYSTSFPIEYFYDNDILMAHKINGVRLPEERGFPFQLAAESKWGYKWIKWITEIELSDDEDYRGYWESRGYSDTGTLDEPFYGD